MRVLLDIDVVLDVLANREPFADEAEAVLQRVESRAIDGLVAAHSITALHSLLSKHLSTARARRVLTDLLHLVQVVAVDEDRVRHALALGWSDFDDAVQAACAEHSQVDYLITRDKRGFRKSAVKILTPAELLVLFP